MGAGTPICLHPFSSPRPSAQAMSFAGERGSIGHGSTGGRPAHCTGLDGARAAGPPPPPVARTGAREKTQRSSAKTGRRPPSTERTGQERGARAATAFSTLPETDDSRSAGSGAERTTPPTGAGGEARRSRSTEPQVRARRPPGQSRCRRQQRRSRSWHIALALGPRQRGRPLPRSGERLRPTSSRLDAGPACAGTMPLRRARARWRPR